IPAQISLGQPGAARNSIGSGKRIGVNLVIGKESDSRSTHFLEDRCMGLLFILPTPDGREAAFREGKKFIEKRIFAIVAAVIVGNRDQVKTSAKQPIISARIPAKVIRFGNRRPQIGDDALQVTGSQIEAA